MKKKTLLGYPVKINKDNPIKVNAPIVLGSPFYVKELDTSGYTRIYLNIIGYTITFRVKSKNIKIDNDAVGTMGSIIHDKDQIHIKIEGWENQHIKRLCDCFKKLSEKVF